MRNLSIGKRQSKKKVAADKEGQMYNVIGEILAIITKCEEKQYKYTVMFKEVKKTRDYVC
jgi:hypothetical protein